MRRYARSKGRRAKNDRIDAGVDAGVIAEFTVQQTAPASPVDPVREEVAGLIKARRPPLFQFSPYLLPPIFGAAVMNGHTLALFAVTTCVVSMTPGPNMLFAMSLGLRYGPHRAAWGGAGMCAALALMAAVSALGLGALLAASATAFEIVRWTGVAYLTWLGISAWRTPVNGENPRATPANVGDGAPWRLFLRGGLASLCNPKALVYMTALFPQFIDPAAALVPQLTALVVVMMVFEFAWIMAYAIGGDRLAARLTDVSAARALNRLTGGLMIAAGGMLAVARRV